MRQTGVERAILVGVWAGSENNGASEGRRGGWAMGRYGRSSARGGGEKGRGGGACSARRRSDGWRRVVEKGVEVLGTRAAAAMCT